jgi:2-polyprenyl-6-methoxyphenol hydroxylase-like FAD-dependent oxidoreductase
MTGSCVVIGGSFAGLFAAAAAAASGQSVTIVERDTRLDDAAPRPGVPQGTQPHVLLYRGLLAMEDLLPGLHADLASAGALQTSTSDIAWLGEHGWLRYGLDGYPMTTLSRPLLELVVRRRVAAHPSVTTVTGRRVVALSGRSGRRSRREARPEAAWSVELDDGSSLAAQLVIDASGRTSRLPNWLAELGATPAPATSIDIRMGYATREYVGTAPLPVGVAVVAAAPHDPRGGLILPVEDGRWLVTAVGTGDQRPPRDVAGFEAHLRGLRDPVLAQLADGGTPTGEVHVHRQTGNVRRAYETLDDLPPGLLVVGDALCAFDPVYGQGITVAACEAAALRAALTGPDPYRPGWERRLQRSFAKLVELPWAIATSEDLRFPGDHAGQTRRQRLIGAWTRQLGLLAAHGDARAQNTLGAVYQLMADPRQLMHPALVRDVVRARLRGLGPPNPRPSALVAQRRGEPPAPGTHPSTSPAARSDRA